MSRDSTTSMLNVLVEVFATETLANVLALMAMKERLVKELLAPMIALVTELASISRICPSLLPGMTTLNNTIMMILRPSLTWDGIT